MGIIVKWLLVIIINDNCLQNRVISVLIHDLKWLKQNDNNVTDRQNICYAFGLYALGLLKTSVSEN